MNDPTGHENGEGLFWRQTHFLLLFHCRQHHPGDGECF